MTRTFRKNVERCKKRGLDLNILKDAIIQLESNGSLPQKYKPHKLSGYLKGRWECHLKPDWLMVWEQDDTALTLIFTNTGTHSDMFG